MSLTCRHSHTGTSTHEHRRRHTTPKPHTPPGDPTHEPMGQQTRPHPQNQNPNPPPRQPHLPNPRPPLHPHRHRGRPHHTPSTRRNTQPRKPQSSLQNLPPGKNKDGSNRGETPQSSNGTHAYRIPPRTTTPGVESEKGETQPTPTKKARQTQPKTTKAKLTQPQGETPSPGPKVARKAITPGLSLTVGFQAVGLT